MSAVKVDAFAASDYAVVKAGPWDFYYGYEWGYFEGKDEWGFRATHETRGVVLSLSFEQLQERSTGRLDKFDVSDCLMVGFGLVAAGVKS